MKKFARHRLTAKKISPLSICRRRYAFLLRRAEIAANDGSREICGNFSIDRRGRVDARITPNRSTLPGTFRIARKDVLPASKRGLIWGAFHSHPISRSYPSTIDLVSGFANRHILIISSLYDDISVWELDRKRRLTRYPVRVV